MLCNKNMKSIIFWSFSNNQNLTTNYVPAVFSWKILCHKYLVSSFDSWLIQTFDLQSAPAGSRFVCVCQNGFYGERCEKGRAAITENQPAVTDIPSSDVPPKSANPDLTQRSTSVYLVWLSRYLYNLKIYEWCKFWWEPCHIKSWVNQCIILPFELRGESDVTPGDGYISVPYLLCLHCSI